MRPTRLLASLVFSIALLGTAVSQQASPNAASGPCALPVFAGTPNEPNMFNDQQEEWLGDVIDQTFRKQFHVIEDPDGTLQKLGDKLVSQLPPSQIHYRFYIVDAPELNSFGTVGGRIYIFRRILAFVQNEGELAAVLGHEIGHIATHQSAIEFSTMFRDLGITQVGDRQDILNKWNQFVDNAAKVHVRFSDKREQREQLVADRVGIYAMARAGYDPAHTVAFLDRLLQTQGKTGGFWSDLFGKTNEDSKRLREAMRNAAPLPANCMATLSPDSESHFLSWQKKVVESKVAAVHEDVPGIERKIDLRPHLREDLRSIKFSPDGKYLLAQDNSSIFVLSRDPLGNLFRIDAPDTYLADFTPDSAGIVFLDKELRVEKWDIASQQRAWLHAVSLPVHCMQVRLSPLGDRLACLTPEFELEIIDVNTGTVSFRRKKFYEPIFADIAALEFAIIFGSPLELVQIQFSPDGHYLLAGRGPTAFGYDLTKQEEIKLSSSVKELMVNPFTFVGPDRIAGYRYEGLRRQLALAKFPGGERLEQFPIQAGGEIVAPRKGDYLLLMNVGSNPVGLVDVKAKKISFGYKSRGFAVYDHLFAGETMGGSVGLYEISDTKAAAIVQLPDSRLSWPRAASFSDDGKWLALAEATRGGMWNLETGERIFHTQHFEGAFFEGNRLIAKFPQHEKVASAVFAFDASNSSTTHLYDVPSANEPSLEPAKPPEGVHAPAEGAQAPAWQMDRFMVSFAREPKEKSTALFLKVFDVRSNKQLWQRGVKTRPGVFYSRQGKTLTMVIADYETIKAEAQDDQRLGARLNAIEGKQGKQASYVIRVLDSSTGNDLGAVLVDTGNLSFRVVRANAVQDTVVVEDSINRTLIYSLKSGEQKGKLFGSMRAMSYSGNLVLIENEKGVADLYDVSNLKSVAHYSFPDRIAHAQFLASDSALMVVTADQTVYRLQVPGGGATASLP